MKDLYVVLFGILGLSSLPRLSFASMTNLKYLRCRLTVNNSEKQASIYVTYILSIIILYCIFPLSQFLVLAATTESMYPWEERPTILIFSSWP